MDSDASFDSATSTSAFVASIRGQVIGHLSSDSNSIIDGPWGARPLFFADHTASSRALQSIEHYLQFHVHPRYANTHSHTSFTGKQTMLLREEARNIVLRNVGADPNEDVVLFAGSGSTGAMQLLVHVLQLQDRKKDTVVFVGPYEHHSNILPWRESHVKVIGIREAKHSGGADQAHLREQLQIHRNAKLKIGAFSAASNVSGITEDVYGITRILKEYGAMAVWDYATASPYVPICVTPKDDRPSLDAIVMSPHKLLGGVGSPGVLCIKKHLLVDRIPFMPGGGTVLYVSAKGHRYVEKFEERNEGGTPNIIGAIRCGLAFQLKERVGTAWIMEREDVVCQKVLSVLQRNPNMVILGNTKVHRLPIVSFLVKHSESPYFVHSSFVSVLLNDLFGIQSRSGCMCAGPYAHEILGISEQTGLLFERSLLDKHEILRPGYVRVNFHWSLSDSEVDFLLNAIDFVATHGWKFLPLYCFFDETGEWKHRSRLNKLPGRIWLSQLLFDSPTMDTPATDTIVCLDLQSYIAESHRILQSVCDSYTDLSLDESVQLPSDANFLRWFLLPSEALRQLQGVSVFKTPISEALIPVKPPNALLSRLSCLAVESPCTSLRDQTLQYNADCVPHAGEINANSVSPSIICNSSTNFDQVKNKPESSFESDSQKSFVCGNCMHQHVQNGSAQNGSLCISCDCVSFIPLDKIVTMKDVERLTKKIRLDASRAIIEYDMIHDGDRILIGVSGGKDSLTLVDILRQIQRKSPVKFSLGCITVDPQTPEYDPSPLKSYFAKLGIPYFYESYPILEAAKTHMNKHISICSFCSRMKRGILYSTLRREGYNVLALGQHADDLAESLFMSIFNNGRLRTMKANYHVENGDIRVIRPLLYVRERLTRNYARIAKLPVIPENCPACFEEPKERRRIKLMLAAQEQQLPDLYSSIIRAMKPLVGMENALYLHKKEHNDHNGVAAPKKAEFTNENDASSVPVDLLPHLQQSLSSNRFHSKQKFSKQREAICGMNGRSSCAVLEDEDELIAPSSSLFESSRC